MAPQRMTYRVQVPKQYPGIQYRKSKTLNDRYHRYAKAGTEVSGFLEDNGAWLRVAQGVFLPAQMNDVKILVPVSGGPMQAAAEPIKPLAAPGAVRVAAVTPDEDPDI